jgi:pimeloyl-ACP methyl ester carboxylesterase
VLGLYRLPDGRNVNYKSESRLLPKPVVLLQHGLLDSSWTWVNNLQKESLGFLLADAGYDVWFGNSRGNIYSLQHIHYPVNSNQFWNFTWDDMAKYDIPSVISYILKTTGQQKLSYIGHSQGTIQAFAAFTLYPNLTDMVNVAVMLAPVAYVSHAGGLLPLMAHFDIDELFLFFGFREFLPDATILQRLAPDICNWFPYGCEDFLFLIVGSSNNLNETRIPVYVSETPAGTSVKNMIHWAQGIRKDAYQMYDYGSAAANIAQYGQPTPPQYDLSKVNVSCALYHGSNDILADPTDVSELVQKLPKIVKNSLQPQFAHLDYSWGYDSATVTMYMDIMSLLNTYK